MLQLSFKNKHLFLSFTYNNPGKKVTNILVFLLSYLTNYQQPMNALSILVTALDSSFLQEKLFKVIIKIKKQNLLLYLFL